MEKIVLKHQKKYPKMKALDFYKLIYQSSFGPSHHMIDPQRSLEYLFKEFDALTDDEKDLNAPFSESIGNGLVRINLTAKKVTRSLLPLINKLFVATSKKDNYQTNYFIQHLHLLQKLADANKLNINREDVKTMINNYKDNNYPAVHHSKIYRHTYKPHYRIIEEDYLNYLPVLKAIEKFSEEREKKIIAIDGRCGSGKTTMAKMIQEVFNCNVFHMDDFFLPFEMKTKKRLAQPGGNVHYERAKTEILEALKNNDGTEAISHRPYNCSIKSFDHIMTTPYKKINIIEGVYSMHPTLINDYDFKIFMTVDEDVQLERINNRNPEQLDMFIKQWIPMEEHYFESLKIKDKCDLVIDTSNFFMNRRNKK